MSGHLTAVIAGLDPAIHDAARHRQPYVRLSLLGTSNNDDFVVGSTVAVARW